MLNGSRSKIVRVEDGHGLVGDASVGVDLLEDLVDEGRVAVVVTLGALLLVASGGLSGLTRHVGLVDLEQNEQRKSLRRQRTSTPSQIGREREEDSWERNDWPRQKGNFRAQLLTNHFALRCPPLIRLPLSAQVLTYGRFCPLFPHSFYKQLRQHVGSW